MNKMALFKYFKVDKRVKEDNSLGNSDAVLPSSSGSLTQTIPASRIDAINDDVKPVVETIMDKGIATTRGTYEKFSADEKARVAKRAAGYGVLSTIRHFARPDRHRTTDSTSKDSTILTSVQYNYLIL